MIQLKCPHHSQTLEDSTTAGEPSLRCSTCKGAWVPSETLDAIEDSVFDQELVKGQRRYGEHPTELPCPHCGDKMSRFRYRGYSLELDACPRGAGFWLEHGEDRYIQNVMKRRTSNLRRAGFAQKQWDRVRRGGKSGSLLDRLKDLFSR